MRVYIAGPWRRRNVARWVRTDLQAAGHEVTSSWLDVPDNADPCTEAQVDVRDVRRSDILVLLNLCLSEGKATELGMAIAWGMPILAIGEPSQNVFHHLPECVWVRTVGEAIERLKMPFSAVRTIWEEVQV